MFDWLILLILDAAALAALLLLFGENRLRRAPRAGLIGLGLALTWLVCARLCRWLFGWMIGLLTALPLTILTAAVLMYYGRLPMRRAALAAVIFLAVRGFLGTLAWLL
jgi:hypothetical protein